jgi:PQQ-dependent dehydrogenase (methanol/ethanol family)
MYVITPFPNYLYALDLTKPGAPTKWTFKPKPAAASQGVACCDVVNRGAVYDNGKIFFNTLDGQTFAVDANSGQMVWHTQLGDIQKGETITMAPLVANGKVLVGDSGGEMGVRGWIAALDEGSGKVDWKAYNTGPDKDVLIGPRFKPFYASDRGKDLGVSTWPPDAWKIGGASVWGWVSYDPETHLIFYGTSNPGPWNPDQRPGDNKWSTGIFARDVDTGQAVWYYQSSPHDLFDHDDVNEIILADIPWGNGRRPVLFHPGRNGYFYVLDRRSGQVLSATPYGYINSSKGVDLKTGRLIPEADKEPKPGRVTRQGLEPSSVQPGHRPRLHPAHQPLPGRGPLGSQLHLRNTLSWRGRDDVRGPGREPRGLHRLGSNPPQAGVRDQGRPAAVEPCPRHRRQRRLLRNHGRLVQGHRRSQRQIALAVQGRQRDHRPAD